MFLPHAIRDISQKFEGWDFVGTNQGSTMTYSLEVGDKIWDEEDGTFSIVEIAAYIRAEMSKMERYIDIDVTGQSCYYTGHDDIEEAWVAGPNYDPTNPEDEARAVIECAYKSLIGGI